MSLNVAVLEQSFARVRPKADQFAADFYERLFTAYPGVRPLFAGTDMQAQQRKLMDSLVLVVENLENGDVLASSLRRLGAKHAGWNVLPEHYNAVGAMLLATFEQHLGPQWTPEVRQAWVDAYGAITSLMIPAAPAGAAH